MNDPDLSDADLATIANFMSNPHAMSVPPVESPFFDTVIKAAKLAPEFAEHTRKFREDGFVVLEDFFDERLIDAICEQFPWLFDPTTVFDAPTFVQDLLHLNPRRRQDAWWVSEPIKHLACDERVLALLELFYGRQPIPFQTLNFLEGTEQATHSDAIHFASIPARFMCGVWVALEDITEDNGPLHYYPGSHKLPDVRLEELGMWGHAGKGAVSAEYELYENHVRALVQAHGLKQERLTVKKGTALIWSNGLLHGGCPITREGSTRMSQVTHYYFSDCVYWSPINSNAALGEYRLKEIHDLRTKERVPHSINGEPLHLLPTSDGNHRLMREGPDSDWVIKPGLPQDVLNVVEAQIQAVLTAPKANALQRAETLAKLCDVALRTAQRAPDQADQPDRQA